MAVCQTPTLRRMPVLLHRSASPWPPRTPPSSVSFRSLTQTSSSRRLALVVASTPSPPPPPSDSSSDADADVVADNNPDSLNPLIPTSVGAWYDALISEAPEIVNFANKAVIELLDDKSEKFVSKSRRLADIWKRWSGSQ